MKGIKVKKRLSFSLCLIKHHIIDRFGIQLHSFFIWPLDRDKSSQLHLPTILPSWKQPSVLIH